MADRTWTGRVIVKGEKKGVSSAFGSAEKNIKGLSNSLKTLGAVAGVAGVGAILKDTAATIRTFEKSISDLSAITGASGADLDRLASASKRIGQTTTLSASQAAEAFKLMASAKPDLLSNLDALEATTAASVTLAEAAGLELPQATAALGESLNQFGAGAQEAERFINVLAAGAKFGSSEINQTAEALKRSGTVAKLAGLSFEETNAAIQALAASGLKGTDAGSKLRQVLVKLQTQANDQFNPAVVGINEALDNLAEANLSVTEKVKIFGEEGVATADILVAQRDVLDTVEEQITGTSEAYDQAQKRTDNLDGAIKRLNSAFEAIQLSFANTAGPMRVIVDTAADIANTIALLNSESSPGSISVTTVLVEGLAISLKTLFTAGVVVKNMLDNIVAVIGFVGRSLVDLMAGNFDLIDDHLKDMVDAINANEEDIGTAAAGVWNPELAAEVDANMRAHFMAPAVAVAQETGAAVAEATRTAGQEAAAEAAAEAEEEAAKEAEKEAKRIERMRERNRTEMEVAAELFAERMAQNLELLELEAITQEQFDERLLENKRVLHEKIAAIQEAAAKRSLTFETMTTKQKVNTILSEGARMTQGVAGQSKTMFKVNKALALAQAVVALPAAVMESYKNAGGYPWGLIPAGIMLATGLAQIQQIKSTQFGGGTTPSMAGSAGSIGGAPVGGAAPGGAGGLPAPFDVGTGEPGAATRGQDVTIKIDGLDEGGLMSVDQVRELMGSISDQLGDGVNIDTGG